MNEASPFNLLAYRQATPASELGVFAVTIEAVSLKVLEKSDEHFITKLTTDAEIIPTTD
jgi:hypothetical protein